jgi:hypothetical protein
VTEGHRQSEPTVTKVSHPPPLLPINDEKKERPAAAILTPSPGCSSAGAQTAARQGGAAMMVAAHVAPSRRGRSTFIVETFCWLDARYLAVYSVP